MTGYLPKIESYALRSAWSRPGPVQDQDLEQNQDHAGAHRVQYYGKCFVFLEYKVAAIERDLFDPL